MPGVADVRSLNNPLGQGAPQYHTLLRVDTQLTMAQNLLADPAQAEAIDLQQATALMEGFSSYLNLLPERFPAVAQDQDLLALQEIFEGGPLQVLARRDEVTQALTGLAERFSAIDDAYLLPSAAGDLFTRANPAFGRLVADYLAADSRAYRLEVILAENPTGVRAMDVTDAIRDHLASGGYQGDGEAVVSGTSALVADMRDTLQRDQVRSFGFVLLGIFLVLLVMLRSMVAPVYLIGTVVLSYTCTLGITNLVFRHIFNIHPLTWWVPFFMFVFLVALGVDYSIFLFGRVKEEVGNHGLREGVHVAVAATGSIITSAGIILSGTFAAVTVGEVLGLREIGFAVSVGVLIDTFVVRTILDPALAAFFGRWTWWPGGVPRAKTRRVAAAPVAKPAGDQVKSV
jgi:RND superfamily putative drug exporter